MCIVQCCHRDPHDVPISHVDLKMCRTTHAVVFVSRRLSAFSYACVFQKLEQANKKLVKEFVECSVKPCLCVCNKDSCLEAC